MSDDNKMTDTDEIMARWRVFAQKAEDLATACQANPADAALIHGVHRESPRLEDGRIFGGERRLEPENEKASWLRAAAAKVIPPNFQWVVHEAVGGGAFLTLRSYDESAGASFLDSLLP